MRLVSYNILNGGEGRADPLAEVLIAQRPDVVALIEADVPAVVERIGRRLGMATYTSIGSRHSVAILSGLPVLESIDHTAIGLHLDRGMLEVVVETGGIELPIVATHLPAGATLDDEANRLRTWQRTVARLHTHHAARRPHVICGDFNANSPAQVIDPSCCKQATRDAWLANGELLPRELVGEVEEAGYTDCHRGSAVGTFDTQTPGQRVDYIFTFKFPPASLRSAWIEHDRLAKYASDHFPIGVELAGGT